MLILLELRSLASACQSSSHGGSDGQGSNLQPDSLHSVQTVLWANHPKHGGTPTQPQLPPALPSQQHPWTTKMNCLISISSSALPPTPQTPLVCVQCPVSTCHRLLLAHTFIYHCSVLSSSVVCLFIISSVLPLLNKILLDTYYVLSPSWTPRIQKFTGAHSSQETDRWTGSPRCGLGWDGGEGGCGGSGRAPRAAEGATESFSGKRRC